MPRRQQQNQALIQQKSKHAVIFHCTSNTTKVMMNCLFNLLCCDESISVKQNLICCTKLFLPTEDELKDLLSYSALSCYDSRLNHRVEEQQTAQPEDVGKAQITKSLFSKTVCSKMDDFLSLLFSCAKCPDSICFYRFYVNL